MYIFHIFQKTTVIVMLRLLSFHLSEFDECESDPCQNDGTCTDVSKHYTCTCVDGYVGVNCETGE